LKRLSSASDVSPRKEYWSKKKASDIWLLAFP
jgi:hypothetical protein